MEKEEENSLAKAVGDLTVNEAPYVRSQYRKEMEGVEENVEQGAATEELAQDSKTLVLTLLKQVRPGIDLSRVVLPTFILEPRSMLQKISDFLVHCELLTEVPLLTDPLDRMINLVKWYLSGFYIKPKGVKKPYNPILGEMFRCMYAHDHSQDTEKHSNTFFVSEQVSHHPPVSAFYASNRKAGFVCNGSILFRTKFTGLSAGSILDGFCTMYLLPTGEEYVITFPSAWASGFLFGTLIMELAGNVQVHCKQSGLSANLDFKQKPFIGGDYNTVAGKIVSQEDHVLRVIQGKWDGRLSIQDPAAGTTDVLWEPTPEARSKRIPVQVPEPKDMKDFESQPLWAKVTEAIKNQDQVAATEEKRILEQAQRDDAKKREEEHVEWEPRLFRKEGDTWTYKYFNKEKWGDNELEEAEVDGRIYSIKKQ